MCISVDLPEPDGPMIAAKRGRREVDADAGERVDRDVALAVAADQLAGADDRARRRRRARAHRASAGNAAADAAAAAAAGRRLLLRLVDRRDDVPGRGDALELELRVVGRGGVEVDGADAQDPLEQRLVGLDVLDAVDRRVLLGAREDARGGCAGGGR